MSAHRPSLPHLRRALRATAAAVLACAALVLLLAGLLVAGLSLTGRALPNASLTVDDLSQLTAALFATAATTSSARRSTGRRRRAWAALAAGCGAWSCGQAVWSWYELVLGHETPFPSVADVGFLGFPVGATAALLLYRTGGQVARLRSLLDGLLVAVALALASWSTALGSVLSDDSGSRLAQAVAIAYPAGDLVVLTMVVVLLGRPSPERRTLTLVGTGMAAIALSDSAFLYLTATDAYGSGSHLVSLGWGTGFLLIGLAGRAAVAGSAVVPAASVRQPSSATLLPYALVALVVLPGLSGGRTDPVRAVLTIALVLLVLARQFVLLREHGHLVGELAAREQDLRHAASHDGLTGLANRVLFQDEVRAALARLGPDSGAGVSVLFCDLDDFKLINDSLGHAAGDALLVQAGERLHGTLRSGDVLARLGGDEFAVLLEGGDPATVGRALVTALSDPFVLGNRMRTVGVSVGIATASPSAPTPTADLLLAQADTAMYAAKREGKGSLRIFEPGMALAELAESELTQALAEAVRSGAIELAYQPILHLGSGAVIGMEALARWRLQDRPVPPSEFIPLAERTGLIDPLTDLVLDRACAQAARWHAELDGRGPTVGVNLSPLSVTDRRLPERVAAVLARHGLRGDSLAVEVTESGVLSDPEAAVAVCGELRALGVHVSLDDFGVGFSSLAQLRLLPLDSVKLDRSLLQDVGQDPHATHFVRAVLRLGNDLGLIVIAEGVELPEQLSILAELGATSVQGYLLARPAPAEEHRGLLARSPAVPRQYAPALPVGPQPVR